MFHRVKGYRLTLDSAVWKTSNRDHFARSTTLYSRRSSRAPSRGPSAPYCSNHWTLLRPVCRIRISMSSLRLSSEYSKRNYTICTYVIREYLHCNLLCLILLLNHVSYILEFKKTNLMNFNVRFYITWDIFDLSLEND